MFVKKNQQLQRKKERANKTLSFYYFLIKKIISKIKTYIIDIIYEQLFISKQINITNISFKIKFQFKFSLFVKNAKNKKREMKNKFLFFISRNFTLNEF